MSDLVLIFANPIAGRGRGEGIARQLEHSLGEAGYEVRPFFERPDQVAAGALRRDAAAAITIGGDGTLRAVAELLLNNGIAPPPLLPIPLGTANLMARHLRYPLYPENLPAFVLNTLRQCKITRLDAAVANNRLFLLVGSVGLDAQVVHLLESLRQGPIDMTSYLVPIVRSLADYSFPPLTVEADGVALIRDTPAIAFIGNVAEYGAGFPVLTRARSDDGLLDVCIMPCRDQRELAEWLLLLPTGEHLQRENVIYTWGRSVRIESRAMVPVQLDGDAAGWTPLGVEVLAGRIPFLLAG